jgi:hypothetical protein
MSKVDVIWSLRAEAGVRVSSGGFSPLYAGLISVTQSGDDFIN